MLPSWSGSVFSLLSRLLPLSDARRHSCCFPLMLSTAVMPSFVLSIIFAVTATATATLRQDISLVPASRFAGHTNKQVPLAARDVLNKHISRQLTCDPGYGLCHNGCCPTTDDCCSNADLCVEVGGACCQTYTCPSNWDCCAGYCSPLSGQCCTTGYYCRNGEWCVLYSGQQYCCDGLGCLGTYNPLYQTVPTITVNTLQAPTNGAGSGSASAPPPPPPPTGASATSSTHVTPPNSTTEPPSAASSTHVTLPNSTTEPPSAASSTHVTPPNSATEPPSAAPTTVYRYYTFTVTWSYDSSYYTGPVFWDYTWSTDYDSTTVSFYCTDYEDASYSVVMYSITEDFPTPTNAALPSTNPLATTTATATGISSSATGGTGSGISSSGRLSASAPGQWQSSTQWFVGVICGSCLLLNLLL